MNPSGEGGEKRIRGRIAVELRRALALGDLSQRALAEQYGFSEQAISQFKQREAAAIEAIKQDEQDELAGLWIAQRVNRVQAYQDDVERIDEWLSHDAPSTELMRVRATALRNAAEETGQLKHQVETTARITYAVEGVDPADLR